MRRGFVMLLMLLSCAAVTSAQDQARVDESGMVAVLAPATLDTVVARMNAFDRNGDGRWTKDELLERMQSLVAKGDENRDGALDRREIVALATAPPTDLPQAVRRVQIVGGYTFGDLVGQTSRSHMEDAVDDLRLSGERRSEAVSIVKAFLEDLQSSAAADLLKEVESALTPEQFADFKIVLDRQLRSQVMPTQSGESHARFVQQNLSMVVSSTDLDRRVAVYPLSAANRDKAEAALERHRVRLGPSDDERAVLLWRLAGVLSDEERDNFRAAVDRRPVVKSPGSGLTFSVAAAGDDVVVSVFR